MNLSIDDIERDNLCRNRITTVVGDKGIVFGNRTFPLFEICYPDANGCDPECNRTLRLYGSPDDGSGLERSYLRFEISNNKSFELDIIAMHDAELVLRLPSGARLKRERKRRLFPDAKGIVTVENEKSGNLQAVFYGRCEIKGRKIRLFSGRSSVRLIAEGGLLRDVGEIMTSVYDKEGAARLFLSECENAEGDALEENVYSAFLMAKDVLCGRFEEGRLSPDPDGRRLLLENRYMKSLGVKPDRKRACLVRDALLSCSDLDGEEKAELLFLNAHALTLSEKRSIIKLINGNG